MKRKISNWFSISMACAMALASFILTSCGTLPEDGNGKSGSSKEFSVEEAFKMVAKENDVARTLYTKAIVGAGKKQGLKFDENWEKDDVMAGPLPALFLRGISADIQQKGVVPLGLYLGSDFPVRKSNKFAGKQDELFQKIRQDTVAKFFYDKESTVYTAMFPDFAVAPACVSCHNNHPETMKSDWKMGDIMGATTWTYPKDSLSFEEVKAILLAYRMGAVSTYNKYLKKAQSFPEVPEIGSKWPSKGYYLPTAEVFIDSVAELASVKTLNSLLKTN